MNIVRGKTSTLCMVIFTFVTPLLQGMKKSNDEDDKRHSLFCKVAHSIADVVPHKKCSLIKKMNAAILDGDNETVRMLFDRVSDIHQLESSDNKLLSPLEVACHATNRGAIEILLSAGLSPNRRARSKGCAGLTLLSIIVNSRITSKFFPHEREALVERFIEKGALVDMPDASSDERYPLHHAAQGCLPLFGVYPALVGNDADVRIVECLLQAGAHVNVIDRGGDTPLHVACSQMRGDIVQLLLEYDALITNNHEYKTPLKMMPMYPDFVSHLMLLLQMPAVHEKGLRDLFKKEVEISDARSRFAQLFKEVLSERNEPMIWWVVGKGLEWGLLKGNHAVWQQAVESGRLPLIDCLLNHGGNIKMRGICGDTALHWAVHKKRDVQFSPVTLLYLIRRGAQVNAATCNTGFTPLHEAAHNGNTIAVEMLLRYGAHINVKDYKHKSPLCYAFLARKYGTAQYLLEQGAAVTPDITKQNYLNYTVGLGWFEQFFEDFAHARPYPLVYLMLYENVVCKELVEYIFSFLPGINKTTRMLERIENYSGLKRAFKRIGRNIPKDT